MRLQRVTAKGLFELAAGRFAGASVLFASVLKLLGASVDLGRADFECVGDLEDACEAGIALAALHAAVVGSVDPAPQRECLLGGAALFA